MRARVFFLAFFLQEFALVPTLQNFRKRALGDLLGKFDLARLHWHFGRRGLQQNVVLGCHFKGMLNSR